jgi:dipeptidyl aminopeptidase/acylaminoacyl peptidase
MHRLRSRALGLIVPILLSLAGIALVTHAFLGSGSDRPAREPCDGNTDLGRVASLRGGALHVTDLRTCRDRVLVRHATWPVRWSPDGKWVAFGDGRVVSAEGGPARRPLGSGVGRFSWTWSPASAELAGVTHDEAVVVAAPDGRARRISPSDWGAYRVLFDPKGRTLAVQRDHGLWTIDVATGRSRAVFAPDRGAAVPASWSPDGRWILFWRAVLESGSVSADGLPLEGVPATGGRAVPIATTLLYDDFLTWCGDRLVAAAGGWRGVTSGKRLVTASAPDWSPRGLGADRDRSWFSPACSRGGVLAVTSTRNDEEPTFDVAERSIRLVDLSGDTLGPAVGSEGDGVSDEFARWSPDGRWLMFVRRAARPQAPARLMLARVDGGRVTVVRSVARLSGQLGYYGHPEWGDATDWYRPG